MGRRMNWYFEREARAVREEEPRQSSCNMGSNRRPIKGEGTAMQEYQPIDLTRFCSVGPQFISPEARPPLGSQSFHGLPFAIAADPDRCFIGFAGEGDTRGRVAVPVGQTARRVLFAHALLESHVMEGENFG